MKIGIVTITNNGYNYGNQLQNYAVKRIYEKLGCTVKTLYNIDGSEYQASSLHKLKNYLYIFIKHPSYPERIREERFRKFGRKYLCFTSSFTFDSIKKILKEKFDYISVGSDQVWNPYFKCNNIHMDYLLLTFIEPDKRIAFSASIGVNSLPETIEKKFRNELSRFKAISVRESTAQKYLAEMLDKEISLIIDPTLVLSKEEWARIAKKPKRFNEKEKYVLTYFLGEKTELVEKDLESLSQSNIKIHHFCDISVPEMYMNGPSEFVYLISHAACVLTDSFHASVFSFIFGIPFYVYDRHDQEKNMNSRFDTFLKTFKLQNQYRKNVNKINIEKSDFEAGYELLETERERAKSFLKKAIKK